MVDAFIQHNSRYFPFSLKSKRPFVSSCPPSPQEYQFFANPGLSAGIPSFPSHNPSWFAHRPLLLTLCHKLCFIFARHCAGAARARADVPTLPKGIFPNFTQFSAPTEPRIQESGAGGGRDAAGKRCSLGWFLSLLVFGCFNFPVALLCFFLPFHHFSAF